MISVFHPKQRSGFGWNQQDFRGIFSNLISKVIFCVSELDDPNKQTSTSYRVLWILKFHDIISSSKNFRETYRHTQRIGSHWNLTNDLENFHPANPTIPPEGLAPSLSGGVAGAAASLQQHCQRSLGSLAPQIPSIRWKGCVFEWWVATWWTTDDWGELRALLRVFLKKGKCWGQKKGRAGRMILLWNWSRNQLSNEHWLFRWYRGLYYPVIWRL